jgi:hypothetical protein
VESEGRRVTHVSALGTDLVPDVAPDREAGFGSGDIEEAGTIHVADTHIFDGFGLCIDDRVSSLRLGDADKRGSCAEQEFGIHGPTSR